MGDRLVTIAKFRDEMQAELAKARLEEAGIKAAVMGSNTFNMLSNLPAINSIELQVFESETEQAKEILSAQEEESD